MTDDDASIALFFPHMVAQTDYAFSLELLKADGTMPCKSD
jgi:hypothetical protein